MASIINNPFRVAAAKSFISSVATGNYYIGLGKITEYQPDDLNPLASDTNPPLPFDREAVSLVTKRNIFGLKKITANDICLSIPRRTWVSNTLYDQYTDNDQNLIDLDFFVVNSALQIYKCLSNNNDVVSTVEPIGGDTSPSDILTLADGYRWKYMGNVSLSDQNKFLSPDFIPVRDSAFAIKGQIVNYRIVDGGSGYSSATAIVSGDGTGATVTLTITGGIITGFTVTGVGSNYTYAEVQIVGSGSGAIIEPILSPAIGHGYSITNELFATNFTISTQIEFDEGTDFLTNNDFRQIVILKDPLTMDDNAFVSNTANCLCVLTVDTITGFSLDNEVVIKRLGNQIGTANVAMTDIGVMKLANVKSPSILAGDTLHFSTATAVINTVTLPEVNIFSTQILYTCNRTPVTRDDLQTETIKINFEF